MAHPEDCKYIGRDEIVARVRAKAKEWGTRTRLAKEMGYSRGALSLALNSGEMSMQLLLDLSEHLGFHWCIRMMYQSVRNRAEVEKLTNSKPDVG